MGDILLTILCCVAVSLVGAVVGDNIRLRRRERERRVVEGVERLEGRPRYVAQCPPEGSENVAREMMSTIARAAVIAERLREGRE